MRTDAEDKAIRLPDRARAAFTHATRRVGLTGDDENEIGRQVALALEDRDTPAFIKELRAAGRPTAAEQKAIDAALTAYAEQQVVVARAREKAYEAARVHHNNLAAMDAESSYGGRAKLPPAFAKQEREAIDTQVALDDANEILNRLSRELQRVRGTANRAATARGIRYVGSEMP
jgi:hypothetical protein